MINDFTSPNTLDFTLLAAAVDPQKTKSRLEELHKATAEFGKTLEDTRRMSEQATKDKAEAEKAKAEAEAKLAQVEDRLNKALEAEKNTKEMLDSREAKLKNDEWQLNVLIASKGKSWDEKIQELNVREASIAQREVALSKREQEHVAKEQAHQERVKRLQEAF